MHEATLSVPIPNALTSNLRRLALGAFFAIFVSPDSVLVLFFGAIGSAGNAIVTGCLLTLTTAVLGLLTFRRNISLLPADYLFLAFVLCIVLSLANNGLIASNREYVQLTLSLLAYPACRFASRQNITFGASSFIFAAAVIVAIGVVVTVPVLFDQWNDIHAKPFVFGFGAAATHFLGTLSYLILALVTTGRLTTRRSAVVSVMIFLPIVIISACLVRFVFIALAGSLCIAIILSDAKQRRHIIAIGLVIFVGIVAGLVARHDKIYSAYVSDVLDETYSDVNQEKVKAINAAPPISAVPSFSAKSPPSCYHEVDPENSIAIRKALLLDALFLIPSAGWIGTGLDSFMHLSCLKKFEIHNSFLQAAVEFGWLGGALLVFFVAVTVGSLAAFARQDCASRFVLCSLVFIVLLSLVYGRTSGDAVLFGFLGCAVGLRETTRAART
jgi:hypothetical protein